MAIYSTTIGMFLLLLAGAAYGSAAAGAQQKSGLRRLGEKKLILNEEFDSFNLDLWKHEITMGGGGNWEFQMYGNNRTNSYVEDGKLFLQPTLTSDYLGEDQVSGVQPITFDMWGLVPADQCTSNMFYGCSRASNMAARIPINPIMSARVRTAGTFSFRYGRIEVKAKLPRGDWLWPAIWLLPEHNAYGQWPASGEIDIMESRGNSASYAEGVDEMGGVDMSSSAFHWGPHYSMDSWDQTYGTYALGKDKGTFNDDFHTFGFYWDENEMYTYVDDDSNRLLTVDFGKGTNEEGFWAKGDFEKRFPGVENPWNGADASAPYDQKFYVVMNVAVGGVSGFFPDGLGGKMWNNKDSDAAMKFYEATSQWFPTWEGKDSALQVESVKVWQTNEDFFMEHRAAAAAGADAFPGGGEGGGGGGGCGGGGGGGGGKTGDTSVSPPASEEGGASASSAGKPSETWSSGSSGGGAGLGTALTYIMCSIFGGILGGVVVGWSLTKKGARPWTRAYETISSNGNLASAGL